MSKLLYLLTILGLNITTLLQAQVKLPDVTFPSPKAKEFIKYVDYPVDFSSGLPRVNIPIYTINTKEFNIPIALNYHASGFKPNERNGYTGQGWNLNAEYRISRIINKTPDEKCLTNLIKESNNINFPYHNNQPLESDPEASYLGCAAGDDNYPANNKDTEYDIFYYGYPGSNGNFIFERNTDGRFIPVTLPYAPIKINTHKTATGDIDYFDIIDEKGVNYRYGRSLVSNIEISETSNQYELTTGNLSRNSGKTSWLLTEIISANKADSICYEYIVPSTPFEEYHRLSIASMQYINKSSGSSVWTTPSPGPSSNYAQRNTYEQVRISKIKFKNGELRFSYITSPSIRLYEIALYESGKSTPMNVTRLDQTPYDSSSPYWYKLDAVKYFDSKLSNMGQYTFKYNEGVFPIMSTPHSSSSYKETYAVDYWGFYNGANNNTMLLAKAMNDDPYKTHPHLKALYGTADRLPNATYAKVGLLQQMTYPTGGNTTYEYEGNITSVTSTPVGGVRIRKVTHNDGNKSISHTYQYGPTTSSTGELSSYIVNGHDRFKSVSYSDNSFGSFTATYTNMAYPGINYNLNSRPITYLGVFEVFGENNNNIGKIEHIYDSYTLDSSLDIASKKYPYIDYTNSAYIYPWYSISIFDGATDYGKCYYQKSYKYGKLQEKQTSIYDNAGNLRKKIERTYSNPVMNTYKGLVTKRIYGSPSSIKKNQYYFRDNYTIPQFRQLLSSEVETEYPSGSGAAIVKTTTYEYNNYNLPVAIQTTTSDGGTRKTTYKYPLDYATIEPYKEMISRNILGSVIETDEYKNNIPISKEKYNYTKWYSNLFAPQNLQVQYKNYATETRLQYINYDQFGNPIYIIKDGIDKTIYLWSYKGEYPIAKIKNATYDEVKSKLGVNPESLSFAKSPNISSVDGMRGNLPNAHIATYTYRNLGGLVTEKDVRGTSTFYEYNDLGQLTYVNDLNNNTIKSYKYNYVNKSSDDSEALKANITEAAYVKMGNGYQKVSLKVQVSGGSGQYTYLWRSEIAGDGNPKITDQSDVTKLDYTSYFFATGNGRLTIYCTVTDTVSGKKTNTSLGYNLNQNGEIQ